MKQKIGIGLLILLNVGFTYLLVIEARLYYGFISIPLGKEIKLTTFTSYDSTLIVGVTFWSIIAFLINYFLFKKMIMSKKSFLISFVITIIGVSISIPDSLSARESFHKSSEIQLQNYLNKETINEVQIITNSDTIQVKEVNNFITDIGAVQYQRGIWKYAKKTKIMLRYTDGGLDSIYTTGRLFEYEGKYFLTDKDIIEKYLTE